MTLWVLTVLISGCTTPGTASTECVAAPALSRPHHDAGLPSRDDGLPARENEQENEEEGDGDPPLQICRLDSLLPLAHSPGLATAVAKRLGLEFRSRLPILRC